MQPVLPTYFTLAVLGVSLTACGVDPSYMGAQSREISADIHATHWDGPTSLNPGETTDLRGEPNGAVPWHVD
jgi:hypothetical protein